VTRRGGEFNEVKRHGVRTHYGTAVLYNRAFGRKDVAALIWRNSGVVNSIAAWNKAAASARWRRTHISSGSVCWTCRAWMAGALFLRPATLPPITGCHCPPHATPPTPRFYSSTPFQASRARTGLVALRLEEGGLDAASRLRHK